MTKTLLAAALLAAVPMMANADSQFTTGSTSPITARAHLDFQVTIPKILYLRVGDGLSMASGGNIEQIAFNVAAGNVGNGTAVAATTPSGDLDNGSVTARVIGNNGNITFTSTTTGPLNNGAGDTISYSQITAAVATLTSTVALPHPTLADGATTTVTLNPVSGKLVNRDAVWTFSYENDNVVAPGIYGGTNANGSRVTYTASMP
ncbi:hypothetical protein M2650_10110 [Luteimonas sp. SX5]|uniref:WxL domain-containing protein n=2 Tax=Luteimonas galliterrae TaxID=2940486 RepID=A0ABT0MJB2_9GAMM|nr:hypothetical protein [Luteimonas galliterrae]